jgi:hypothetical protein
MSKELKAQVCDATTVDQGTEAGKTISANNFKNISNTKR